MEKNDRSKDGKERDLSSSSSSAIPRSASSSGTSLGVQPHDHHSHQVFLGTSYSKGIG